MLFLSGFLGLLLFGLSADLFSIFDKADSAEAGAEDDILQAEPQAAPDLFDPVAPETTMSGPAEGTSGNDILWGGADQDEISGGAGDDQINGYAGDDLLSGGSGSDDMHGGTGDDLLAGGDGIDALSGNDGADTLLGGAGDDSLMGGMGDDLLDGGPGNDLLQGGSGADVLLGGDGDDSLQGGAGADTLSGGLGSDELFGDGGSDVLIGVVPDRVTGLGDFDTGQDLLNGGSGDDLLVLGSNDFGNGGEGSDLFALGDWIDPAHPATILFEPEVDRIALVYDPAAHPDPAVTIETSTTPDAVWIKLDGFALAEVLHGAGLRAGDIELMTPQALAAMTGV
ncbi:MAG: calcium-binding protein [Rhodobacteraceae bacterium]|nr:calcium-binding protein [Paracoccaceae bacterium]